MSGEKRVRRRRKHKGKIDLRQSPEMTWGARGKRSKTPRWVLIFGVVIGLVMLIGFVGVLLWPVERRVLEKSQDSEAVELEELGMRIESAAAVAKAFLTEIDPAKRLQWVLHPEEVKERMVQYPEEALSMPGKIEKVLGHRVAGDGNLDLTAFVVAMPAGDLRLLEVVATRDGPKVDWDAYARYGTASWEDLWSGKADRAVVRVFCEPATERLKPFDDQMKWTAFRLSSPDLPQVILGYTEIGSVRETMMKHVILSSPRYRQQFVLEIVRHAGQDEPTFEIKRCLAVGWNVGERDIEEIWQEQQQPQK